MCKRILLIPLLGILLTCSNTLGPPLPELKQRSPARLTGSYFFKPRLAFFHHLNLGLLHFKKIQRRGTGDWKRTDFKLQILGQMRDGSVRIRSWEGTAWYDLQQDSLELQSERCYVFGKRYWEDRLSPLQRWQCDHLVLRFYYDPQKKSLQSRHTPRTRYSDWFGDQHIYGLPGLDPAQTYLTGYVIPITDLIAQERTVATEAGLKKIPLDGHIKSRLSKSNAIVWAINAGLLARPGQELQSMGAQGQTLASLKIISHPGQFLLVKTQPQSLSQVRWAWTKQNLRPSGKLF